MARRKGRRKIASNDLLGLVSRVLAVAVSLWSFCQWNSDTRTPDPVRAVLDAQFEVELASCKSKIRDQGRKPRFCVHCPPTAHNPNGMNLLPLPEGLPRLVTNCSHTDAGVHLIDVTAAANFEGWSSDTSCKILFNLEPPAVYELLYGFDMSIVLDRYGPVADLFLSPGNAPPGMRAHPLIPANTWIQSTDQGMHPKTKQVSIVASSKTALIGHQLRHEVINSLGEKHGVHALGRGYRPFDNKADGLRDYRFSIVIENIIEPFFITEKLIDAFLTGTVPIYWGSPIATQLFDARGMFVFSTIQDLDDILTRATEAEYEKMLPYIRENLARAKNFQFIEQFLDRYYLGRLSD